MNIKIGMGILAAKAAATLLDDKHDLSPVDAVFKDGVLTLVKPDFHSAVFFVEFE